MVSLAPIEAHHLPRLAELANNASVVRFLRDRFPHPYTIQDAQAYFDLLAAQPPRQTLGIFVDGVFAGAIMLIPKDDVARHTAELGYWLGEPYWGQGITTESIRQMLPIAWGEFGLARLLAHVQEGNTASIKALERNGFQLEGVLRKGVLKQGRYWDDLCFGLLNPDFDFGS